MDKFHTDITQIGNLINSLITDLEEKYLGRNVYVEMYEKYGVIDMIYYSALKCEIRLTVCLFEKDTFNRSTAIRQVGVDDIELYEE